MSALHIVLALEEAGTEAAERYVGGASERRVTITIEDQWIAIVGKGVQGQEYRHEIRYPAFLSSPHLLTNAVRLVDHECGGPR